MNKAAVFVDVVNLTFWAKHGGVTLRKYLEDSKLVQFSEAHVGPVWVTDNTLSIHSTNVARFV